MAITAVLLFIFLLLDQGTKYLVERVQGEAGTVIYEIPKFVTIEKSYNTGMAWSMLADNTWILVIISAIATVILSYIATKNDWKHGKLGAISMTMALAGCVGNFIDRSIYCLLKMIGHPNVRPGVVDMISFKPFDWFMGLFHASASVFNVADMFLVVGLILFVIDYIFFYDKRVKKYGLKN